MGPEGTSVPPDPDRTLQFGQRFGDYPGRETCSFSFVRSHSQGMDLDTGHELRTLQGHLDEVLSVILTGDGRRALSASQDGTVRLWSLATGQVLATFYCDGLATTSAFVDGTRRILAGDSGGRIYLLQVEEPT